MNLKLMLILAGIMLSLSGSVAFATESAEPQSPAAQGQAGAKARQALVRFKAALAQLDLGDRQIERIKAVVSEATAKLESLKGEKGERGERREIVQKARREIVVELDERQKAKLKEILGHDKPEPME